MIVRCIGLHLIPDPFPEGLGALSAEELTVHLQQVGPFVGPMIDVIVVAHELIHQLGALGAGFALVGEKFFDHVHAGRKAGKVEVNAADEIRIAAQAGWLNLHALPFGGGEPVDLAPGFRLFPDETGAVAHCGYCCSGVGAFEACEHSRFAAALGILRPGAPPSGARERRGRVATAGGRRRRRPSTPPTSRPRRPRGGGSGRWRGAARILTSTRSTLRLQV